MSEETLVSAWAVESRLFDGTVRIDGPFSRERAELIASLSASYKRAISIRIPTPQPVGVRWWPNGSIKRLHAVTGDGSMSVCGVRTINPRIFPRLLPLDMTKCKHCLRIVKPADADD